MVASGHKRNRGKGAAMLKGTRVATCLLVIFSIFALTACQAVSPDRRRVTFAEAPSRETITFTNADDDVTPRGYHLVQEVRGEFEVKAEQSNCAGRRMTRGQMCIVVVELIRATGRTAKLYLTNESGSDLEEYSFLE